ncbi:hypothetical protein BSY19_1 [Bosea sp. RAC05]|nr:hypothetical protein BSY19_1 [Bosea sp. RAC05]
MRAAASPCGLGPAAALASVSTVPRRALARSSCWPTATTAASARFAWAFSSASAAASGLRAPATSLIRAVAPCAATPALAAASEAAVAFLSRSVAALCSVSRRLFSCATCSGDTAGVMRVWTSSTSPAPTTPPTSPASSSDGSREGAPAGAAVAGAAAGCGPWRRASAGAAGSAWVAPGYSRGSASVGRTASGGTSLPGSPSCGAGATAAGFSSAAGVASTGAAGCVSGGVTSVAVASIVGGVRPERGPDLPFRVPALSGFSSEGPAAWPSGLTGSFIASLSVSTPDGATSPCVASSPRRLRADTWSSAASSAASSGCSATSTVLAPAAISGAATSTESTTWVRSSNGASTPASRAKARQVRAPLAE